MFTPFLRICLGAFLVDFAVMIFITAMPFYVYSQLGGGAAMSGGIGAAQAVCYALASFGSAWLVSRAKNGMIFAVAGAILFGFFSCLFPMSRNPHVCMATATIAMASMALVWPALHAWVGGEPDVHLRAKRMGWFNISWSCGFALSPLAAGPLFDHDYRLPFFALTGLCAVCAVLLRSLPHEKDHYHPASEELLAARAGHDRASEAHLYSAWCATFAGSVLATVTRNVFPKRIDELVASGELRFFWEDAPAAILTADAATKYSWLAFALGATTVLSFFILGRTRRWHHNAAFVLGLEALVAAAFWALGTTRSLAVMSLCFIVTGAFAGVTFFQGVYYSMADTGQKHRRAAINEGAVGLGGFAGSLVFGYLAGRHGMAMPFHYTPVFVAAMMALQMAFLRHGRRRED
ncbi:MAG TPA: MFS transporter [Candidatus Hydrogenedentes bacterium]|nr:MFS transporter [Candidatus Hydrogenedentota bacterium]HOV75981.1 MFS transporter [Candidatus Hydrogenedentota bacterium]